MTKGRKLTATFSNGAVLTRTTSIPTLSHAWCARGANYWKTDKAWHEWTVTGFASSAEKARNAANSCGHGTKRIDSIEIVACTEG